MFIPDTDEINVILLCLNCLSGLPMTDAVVIAPLAEVEFVMTIFFTDSMDF
jgi:hypothetical protein